ncbi:MAG TPA: hypothetical protein VIV15_14015, partial [Anaerolineales bacterium]
MTADILMRLFNRRAVLLELTLAALACLPLAARRLLPDAGVSLLLPVTLIGGLLAWAVTSLRAGDRWKRFLLAGIAPALLVVYVGRLAGTLLAVGNQTLLLLPRILGWGSLPAPADLTPLAAAWQALAQNTALLFQRALAWLIFAAGGAGSEDPAARALVWSLGLWMLAVWAGWQVRGRGRVLAGLLPTTLALGLIFNSSYRYLPLLWVHLAALVLLLGLLYYEERLRLWQQAARDYVELAGMYSVVSATVLTVLLVGSAYFASVTSVKEFLDKFRERPLQTRPASVSAPAGDDPSVRTSAGFRIDELLGTHRILAGQELSPDTVMTISTGELPRMPRYANPTAPYHYWRTITFERYSGHGWSNPAVPLEDVQAGNDLVESPLEGYKLVHQVIHFPAGSTGRLYWTGILLRAQVPLQLAWHGGNPETAP